jgi:RHS repeat-associated protein
MDPDQIRGGRAWEEKEKKATEKRRAAALKKLHALTDPDPKKLADAHKRADEIKLAHLPAALGGLARATEEVQLAAKRVEEARTPAERKAAEKSFEAAGVAVAAGVAHAEKEAKKPGSPAALVAPAIEKAKRFSKVVASASGTAGLKKSSLPGILKAGPPARAGQDLKSVRPRLAPPMSPPQPRTTAKLGEALPEETRQFYAEILDAKDAWVETPAGAMEPAMLAAGFDPQLRLAGGPALDLLDLVEGAQQPPGADDLAQTPDTRMNADMQAAVTAAAGSPLALYNLVHDGTDAEPYYGSKKGALGAFMEKSGNDADLSSLLVALLRASNIPARYEYGTVDLSPAQAMAWTGTTDPGVAADVLFSTGIPATRITDGTKVTAVRMEHVWVRAYVPYSNYRGLPRQGSRSMWVRLDPTLKRANVKKAVDLRGKVAFDYAGFFATIGPQTPLERYERQLRDYVDTHGLFCSSLDDAIPSRERIADGLTLLPAELPAPVVSSLASFAAFPSSMRHTASVGVDDWSVSLGLPDIYGSALTLRYRGASPAAEAAIAAAGGIGKLASPSTIQVVPTLVQDGIELGRGAQGLPGLDQDLTVELAIPHAGISTIRHHIFSGSLFAVGLPVGTTPDSVVAAREAEYRAAKSGNLTGDDLETARANRALWRYFWHADKEESRLFGLSWMRLARDVSEGIAGRLVNASLLFGTPVTIRPGNFLIDVPRYSIRPYGVDGDQSRVAAAAELSGYQGSTREHLIWEETLFSPAISTVRIFQVASQQGVQLLSIATANQSLIASLPYSAEAKADMTDAVHAGLLVKVPERPVTYGSYANAEGYVLEDTLTGAGDFRINGLFSGGSDDSDSQSPGVSCPVCGGSNSPATSSVQLSRGNMYFAETDLTLPARGIPVVFSRRYDSLSPFGGRLGPGWQHSYEVRLVADPDGSQVFVNDAFQAERFQIQTGGSFATPAGYHETLVSAGSGFTLTFKDGTAYNFRPDGQLATIADLNGHVVTLGYDTSNRPATVTDATGRAALTFAYDTSGVLASVTDAAARVVQFGHANGDLTSVTDVLGNAEGYGYASNHQLAIKTDKLGNTTYEFYDADGRWVGGREPDGFGRTAAYDFLNRRAVATDKRGSLTLFAYNANGNPTKVTDPLGNSRVMEWDGSSNRTAETDARGNRTVMNFDAAGNLLSRTDPLGAATAYTYDSRSRVLTTTDAASHTSANVYDSNGNLTSSTDANGATTSYGYTSDGLPQTITQPGAATTALVYNANGNVTSMTDPTAGATALGYDSAGHLASITDALAHTRLMGPDLAGRVTSMTDALGNVSHFEYDARGNRTASVDALGNRTTFAYDSVNRLVSTTDAKGNVTRTEHDPEGNVTARIDALGHRTTYRYDLAGRLIEVTDASGGTTTTGYCADIGGQPCAVVDALGNVTTSAFDNLGRVTATTDPNGNTTSQQFDLLGRRASSTDGAGHASAFAYDAIGRLTAVTDALNGVTGYGYDARGNRTTVTDANGRATTFTFDKANRLLTETNPIGNVTTYTYDAAGNRATKVDGNGSTTTYTYDSNRRLTRVSFADGSHYVYAYDARGNRTLERNAGSTGTIHERALVYDELSRLQQAQDHTLGRILTYAYDGNGNRSRMAIDTGEVTTYRWDASGRLAELVDPDGDATRFSYDADGRRSRVVNGNSTTAAWSYDAGSQVTGIAYANPAGQVLTSFGYVYDTAGNRLSKAFADGTSEMYGYDALNRLTRATYPGGRDVSYFYDPVGNRLSLLDTSKPATTTWATSATASSQFSPTYGAASAATGAPDITGCSGGYSPQAWTPPGSTGAPEWLAVQFSSARKARGVRIHETTGGGFVQRVDLVEPGGAAHTVYSGGDKTACGETLVIAFAATGYSVATVKVYTGGVGQIGIDAVGLDAQAVDAYSYNGFNQLTAVSSTDGSSTTFAYDGNGNQVGRTDASGLTQYVYDLDNRLRGIALAGGGSNAFEYDANGLRTKKVDSTGTRSFLLDGLSVAAEYQAGSRSAFYAQSLARIDEVLSVVNGSGKYWYEADALGSTYALTSRGGVAVARTSYDAFGVVTASTGAIAQPFAFTGLQQDLGSEVLYGRQRYAEPRIGRWTSPDPAGFVDGPNRFLYVLNNPTNNVDRSGTWIQEPVLPSGSGSAPGTTFGTPSRTARLYYAFQVGVLGTTTGYRLYLIAKLSPRRVFFQEGDAGGFALGDTHETPRVSSGCTQKTSMDIRIILDTEDVDRANAWLASHQRAWTVSDAEVLVHEMQHAVDMLDGSFDRHGGVSEEDFALGTEVQARLELGYDLVSLVQFHELAQP